MGRVKLYKPLILLLLTLQLHSNSFEKNCIPCHKEKGVSLKDTFMQSILVYSGKENFKEGLKYFFKHPTKETSVMGKYFIKIYGIKEPLHLNPKELDEALEIYWDKYKVSNFLY